MPKLKGTDKQTAWGHSQRLRIMRKLHERIDALIKDYVNSPTLERHRKSAEYDETLDHLLKFKEYLRSQSLASWWIDRREVSHNKLLRDWEDDGEPELSEF